MNKVTVVLQHEQSPTLTLTVEDMCSYEEFGEFFNLVLAAAGCSGLEVVRKGSGNDGE